MITLLKAHYFVLLTFSLFAICFSCRKPASTASSFSASQEEYLISELRYIKYEGFRNKITSLTETDPLDGNCHLSPMPGKFIGGPTGIKLSAFRIKGPRIGLRIGASEAKILTERVQTQESAEKGLLVTPREAKFARLATVCNDLGTGFSSRAANNLLLVYFDRAAIVKGKITDEESTDTIDLAIPTAGFYFLERVVDSKNQVSFRIFDGPERDIFWVVIKH